MNPMHFKKINEKRTRKKTLSRYRMLSRLIESRRS